MTQSSARVAALLPHELEHGYAIQGTSLEHCSAKAASQSDAVIAVVDDRELIAYQFELQRDLTPEQLDEAVEIKMFQDAGLNPMLEYRMVYSRRPKAGEERMLSISAFAASSGALSHALGALYEELPYIDAALPLSTLPYALYHAEILEPKRDIFLYFQADHLSISLFDQGSFVYSKQQEMGLIKLLDEYALLSRDRPEREAFFRLLVDKGVDPAHYTPEEQAQLLDLRELLTKSLSGVQNILLYLSRVAGFEGFDRIFIGSSAGPIAGVENLAQEVLEIEAFEFNFWTPFYLQGDAYVDQMAILALLEGSNRAAGLPANPLNISHKQRPDAFLKRPAGRLVALAAAGLLVAILWPGAYYALGGYQQFQAQRALTDLGQTRSDFEAQQRRMDALVQERDAARDRRERTREERRAAQSLLEQVHQKRVAQDPLSIRLASLFSDLQNAQVYVDRLLWEEGRLLIEVHSQADTRITDLVNRLVGQRHRVEMGLIEKEGGRYYSTLKVGF